MLGALATGSTTLGLLALVAAVSSPAVVNDSGALPPPRAPVAPNGCQDTLRADGLRLSPWPLRPTTLQSGVVCEAPAGIAIQRGASGLRFQPAARVSCAFGLRLARFEAIVQEEAKKILRSPVRSVVQLGTYNCRRMARFPDLVSEHSFANAIDVEKFMLGNGRNVVVERDWVRADQPARTPGARFLRKLARRLYDEQVFSVVLTPSYDAHHRNHFHLDGAPYTVDGT